MISSRSLPTIISLITALGCAAVYSPVSIAQENIDSTSPQSAMTQDLAAQKLQELASEYYEKQSEFEPITATYNGDNRYDDRLPMTLDTEVKAKQIAMWRDIGTQLRAIKRDSLSAKNMVTYDCLQYEIQANLNMVKYNDRLLPINQMDSIPVTLAQFASGQSAQLLQTVPQYEAFLHRLAQLPEWIKLATMNMHEGMRRGIVLPKALVISTLPQYKQLLSDTAENHPYYIPVKNFPASFTDEEKTRLTEEYRKTIETKVLPSLREFETFLRQEYLPACRTSSGWSALPNGRQWYRAWVRDQTTTNLSPEQIYAIGIKEVARIQKEFVELGPKLGYRGDPNGLPAWIDTQPQYRPFKTEADVLNAYREIDKAVRAKLPQLFGHVPKAQLDIRAEPEISRKTASDHYTPPAIDGSRPGVFWAVINNPADYSTTGMTTLFLHEGQPGHHFHLATLQELDVPKFRKVGGNNAFTEGWALYAETLGKEMGLFENNPNAYLGHLTDELLRATRLVVDTGLHAKGWTREQAIRYQQTTLGYSEAAARQATERYMAWPGQALGYKIGSLKIIELRQRAKAALGDRFDLRQFHDVVLSDGTLPLSLLEMKINKWIAEQKKRN